MPALVLIGALLLVGALALGGGSALLLWAGDSLLGTLVPAATIALLYTTLGYSFFASSGRANMRLGWPNILRWRLV